jgi:23S rRNA pseudouridine2605 synthase
MRLAKFLASAGIASRRASEELIRDGRVTVGAETVTDPARDVSADSDVRFDGAPVAEPDQRVVYALNKPAGVVSTARDTHGRPTVVSLIKSTARLYPVGRLDINTTGLILLTNDGALANALTHPRYEVQKTYRVTVARSPVAGAALARLREGVRLEDGVTAPARVRRVSPDTFEITIREGRNRQVRRMCEAIGHRVSRLERIRFGSLSLGALQPGSYRELTAEELRWLSAARAARRAARSSRSASARPRRA